MSARAVNRNRVVQAWGTPHETIGSVNEPREREENGHRFNEQWTYRLSQPAPNRPVRRILYWFRYDFVASYLVTSAGDLISEDLADVLARIPDRGYHSRSTPPT